MKWIIALAGFVALGIGGIHYDVFAGMPGGSGIHNIETKLKTHAERALHNANLDWVNIEIHGQEAWLSGTAPSKTALETARMAVLHSVGKGGAVMGPITAVNTDQIKIQEKKDPEVWQVQKLPDGQWTFSGSIADAKSRQALIDFLIQDDQTSADHIKDRMHLASGMPTGWNQRAQMLLKALSRLDVGTARMRDDRLSLQGSTNDAKIKTEVEELFTRFKAPDKATTSIVLTPPPKPAPKPSDPFDRTGCQHKFTEILGKDSIHFATSKAIINQDSYALMDQLAELAQKCASHTLVISGHTDPLGDPAFNDWLSLQRALAVKNYFVNKGIDENTLRARGAGSMEPLCSENTRSCRQRNRRIEISIE
ncbi:MAG: OmpA family protein [Robiginitomaculum sp.]|nr:OmpA family protein [Robiginitomaculum sp.]MDQ7077845.1 OmpA family protein [Robiginitomaculum sp.]